MYLLSVFGTQEILIIVISVLLFFLEVAILRWVFRIDTQVKNQEAIIWILLKLSAKSGVDPEELDQIIKAFKIK